MAGNLNFTEFTARNIHRVFFLSKCLISVLHLLSFFLFFLFSQKLLSNKRAAWIAMLAYATSFPILYYMSRISVEPLMVIFFLSTFLSIWSYNSHWQKKNWWKTYLLAGLAGAMAISGLVTKLNHLAPLPSCGTHPFDNNAFLAVLTLASVLAPADPWRSGLFVLRWGSVLDLFLVDSLGLFF